MELYVVYQIPIKNDSYTLDCYYIIECYLNGKFFNSMRSDIGNNTLALLLELRRHKPDAKITFANSSSDDLPKKGELERLIKRVKEYDPIDPKEDSFCLWASSNTIIN